MEHLSETEIQMMENSEKLGRCVATIDYKYLKGIKLCSVYGRAVGRCNDCAFEIKS